MSTHFIRFSRSQYQLRVVRPVIPFTPLDYGTRHSKGEAPCTGPKCLICAYFPKPALALKPFLVAVYLEAVYREIGGGVPRHDFMAALINKVREQI